MRTRFQNSQRAFFFSISSRKERKSSDDFSSRFGRENKSVAFDLVERSNMLTCHKEFRRLPRHFPEKEKRICSWLMETLPEEKSLMPCSTHTHCVDHFMRETFSSQAKQQKNKKKTWKQARKLPNVILTSRKMLVAMRKREFVRLK